MEHEILYIYIYILRSIRLIGLRDIFIIEFHSFVEQSSLFILRIVIAVQDWHPSDRIKTSETTTDTRSHIASFCKQNIVYFKGAKTTNIYRKTLCYVCFTRNGIGFK